MQIRPLTPADVPAAHALSYKTFAAQDRALGLPVPEHTDDVRRRGERRVAHLQRTDPDSAWVAEDDGQLVGVALALRRGPLWFLSLLTVDAERHGQGIGGRLLERALTTARDAAAGWILSSGDPRALRSYARAGFAPHAGYDARGRVDRARLPAGLGVRTGDANVDAGLVDDVMTRLRGAPYGPDLDALLGPDAHLLVAEDGRERGFCAGTRTRVLSVGATTPALAQRLLHAALADTDGEIELNFLTADQQWAIDVVLDARLALRPGSSSCRRGSLGPLTPLLPSGAYG